MIELEIQTLSESREGLLIDVGGVVVACGFTLLRQRLAQDPHGTLLTMVVRGPSRKQRALEDALDALERIISFEVSPFEPGQPRPHFAASRTFARPPLPPRPAETGPAPVAETPSAPVTRPVCAPTTAKPVDLFALPSVALSRNAGATPPEMHQTLSAPQAEPEREPDFILPDPPVPAPVFAEPEPITEPFVERVPSGPDEAAVEAALPKLLDDHPHVFPVLEALEKAVDASAREESLWLAGQRLGLQMYARRYAALGKLDLSEAIERIGVAALGVLVPVRQHGDQVHIAQSPLCPDEGHSGCQFFNGYLAGLLTPALTAGTVSVFTLCCRSCGADECVLAITPESV